MSTEKFDIGSILEQLEKGAIAAAQEAGTEFLKEAAADATDFVTKAVPSMSRYTQLLVSKQITVDEFRALMNGLLDVAEMKGITAAGASLVRVDKTRNAITRAALDIILGSISKIA